MEDALRRFHHSQGIQNMKEIIVARTKFFGPKLSWFMEKGWQPHPYQLAFHTLSNATGVVLRFRMLVAGRRGGKTLCAAWEVVYYCLHPVAFHWDTLRKVSEEPLHVWVLVPNYSSAGRAAMRAIQKVLTEAGCRPNHDYRWNRGGNFIEFKNGTLLEFKSAEQADQLIGAGIHILWIDEAGAIQNADAYEYASPALDDNIGIVLGTSTPRGKNWWYREFWSERAHADENIGTVEYRTCDNPYFPKEVFFYRKATYHPLRFQQEYLAAFDATAGKELSGDWLHYYEIEDLPLKVDSLGHTYPDGRMRVDNFELDYYVGVDPAVSLNDRADFFAAVVLGISKEMQVYVLDVTATRLPFPEQVELIVDLHKKWHPHLIGIENNTFQSALAQQVLRHPSLPPVYGTYTSGKKSERILSMSPVFKLGRVMIRSDQSEFIDEWINYDSDLKNPQDDVLDATEIALTTAGIILPGLPPEEEEMPAGNFDELAERIRKDIESYDHSARIFDDSMGGEW